MTSPLNAYVDRLFSHAPDRWADERVNDLFVYRAFAAPVLDGALPYRDVFFEYPPVAAPVILIPGLDSAKE